jgi:Fe-S-cluster-containing dehydrogenase component
MKFLCDAERCIECNACVTACKNEHEVPWGINRRRVVTINDGEPGERSISVACMHCSDAPCMAVCPVDCFYQTEEGVVLHSKDLCIGCGYCFYACPFGAPQFPQAGNFGSRGKMDKCTFCAGGPEETHSAAEFSASTAATASPKASCRSAPRCAPPRPCWRRRRRGVGHLPRARGGPRLRLGRLGLGHGLRAEAAGE